MVVEERRNIFMPGIISVIYNSTFSVLLSTTPRAVLQASITLTAAFNW